MLLTLLMMKIILIFLLKLNSHHLYTFTSLVIDTEAKLPCFAQLLQSEAATQKRS